MKKYIGTKVIMAEPMTMAEAQKVLGRELKPSTLAHIIIKTKMNSRAWHFCDICDYKDKCEYRRKVVVCPYLKIEKNSYDICDSK